MRVRQRLDHVRLLGGARPAFSEEPGLLTLSTAGLELLFYSLETFEPVAPPVGYGVFAARASDGSVCVSFVGEATALSAGGDDRACASSGSSTPVSRRQGVWA